MILKIVFYICLDHSIVIVFTLGKLKRKVVHTA